MDESQIPVEMAQPLPAQMRYSQLLEKSAPAIYQTRSFTPTNGSVFSPDNAKTIEFALSVSANNFLDTSNSYFEFEVEMKNTLAVPTSKTLHAVLDGGMESAIESVVIIGPSGEVLERVNNNHLMAQALKCVRMHKGHADTIAPLTEGFSGISPAEAPDSSWVTGTVAGTARTRRYTMNLTLSALFNSDRYLPLGYVAGSSLRVQLTLAPAATCTAVLTSESNYDQAAGQSVSYSIKNARYQAATVQFDQSVSALMSSLIAETGGVQLMGTGMHEVAVNSIGAGTVTSAVTHTLSIPVRNKSTLGLFHLFHDAADLINPLKFSVSTRRTRGMTTVSHSIGGVKYPLADIDVSSSNPVGMMMNVLKIFYDVHNTAGGGLLTGGTGESEVGAAATYNFYAADTASSGGTRTGDGGCSYLVAQGFGTSPGGGLDDGLDLSSQSNNVDFTFRSFGGGGSLSTSVHSYVLANRIFTFTASGVILAGQ